MATPNIHKNYIDLDGTSIDSDNNKITRGSDSYNLFQIITPFDTSLTLDIAFELANGRNTTYLPLRNDGDTEEVTLTREGEEVTETWNVFYQNIPYNVLSTIALIKNATRSNQILYSVRVRESNPLFLGEYDTLVALQTAHPTPSDGKYATVVDTTYEWVYDFVSETGEWMDLGFIKSIYANTLVVSTKTLTVSPSVISSEEPISDVQYDLLKSWISDMSNKVDTIIANYLSQGDAVLEYLSRNGTNNMQASLPMNENDIVDVKEIYIKDVVDGQGVSAKMGYQNTDGNNYQVVYIEFTDGRRLQIGEEFYYNFRNVSGVTVNSGNVIMTDGMTQGNQAVDGYLFDEASPNSMNLVGVGTVDNIANNSKSKATYMGIVSNIDLSDLFVTGVTYAEGQIIYARGGKLSNVKPDKPNRIVRMGAIINQVGSKFDVVIAPLIFQRFDELSDSEFVHTLGHTPMSDGTKLINYDLQGKMDSLDGEIQAIEDTLPLKADLVGGLVPASQLPSYVDDVIEVATYADLPATGEQGKLYVVIADETSGGNTSTYRWSGSVYVQITDTLSASDVKTLYESNANTNAFTDALLSKLNGIEAGANLITKTSQLINDGEDDGNPTNSFVTVNDLGNAGFGDMTEAEYNTSGRFGIVDEAMIAGDLIFPSYDTMNGIDDDDEVVIRDVSSGITKKTKVSTFRIPQAQEEEYGVREVVGQSSPDFERVKRINGVKTVGSATDLVANVGIDDEVVQNSFDYINIFNRERVTIISDNGVTQQSNVMVKVNKYYIKEEFKLEGGINYHYLWMSEKKLTGYRLPLPFLNDDGSEKDFVYLSAYEGFVDENNVLRSISGVLPSHTITRGNFRTYARNNDTNDNTSAYLIQDIQDAVDLIQIPIWIEFATKNSDNIGRGVVDLTFDEDTVADSTVPNTAIIANNANFDVDMTIYLSTGTYHKITAIDVDTPIVGQTTLTFDGATVTPLTGVNVDPRQYETGLCDGVVASTGFYKANDGKHPFVWRGIENVWGNIWKFVDGIKISDNYTWVCTDFKQYNDTASDVNGDYALPFVKLNYQNGLTNGYIKQLGLDNSYPFAKLPIEVGAGTTTYHADYYYQNTGDRTALLGGDWVNSSGAGVSHWSLSSSLSGAFGNVSARLSYRP